MKYVPATFGVFLLAAAVSASVHAQQAAAPADPDQTEEAKRKLDAVDLESVVVTGTRSPKAIDKIPGAITLVTKEEIKNTLAVTEDATAVLARTVPMLAAWLNAGRLPPRQLPWQQALVAHPPHHDRDDRRAA